MKEQEINLSEKEIWAEIDLKNGDNEMLLIFPSKDVKEKIQNAQRRLKNLIEKNCIANEFDVLRRIDKIFLEEFGEKLTK